MLHTLGDEGASFASRRMSRAGCAQTTVQIRKKVRTKHERRTDFSSHPRGRVADFNLGTQQNMEVRVNFHLRPKLAIDRGL